MLRMRLFSSFSCYVSPGFQARPCIHRFSTIRTDLEHWQRHYHRLTQLQRAIRYPPPESINVDGKNVKLPLPAVAARCSPSQEELEYLVGFFDGDGCVSMQKQTGVVQLAIGQNVDSAEVLVHFRSLLGGSICSHSAPTGSRKALVQWRACGSKMIAAAETLSTVPSMKQAQLLIAMQGAVSHKNWSRVSRDMQMLKQKQHAPTELSECSWTYFAGFFDAQGCVRPSDVGFRLLVGQTNPFVLA